MSLADRAPQSVGGLRHGDQMDMVGHQAVRPDLNLLGTAPLRHQFAGSLVVLVAKERLLPTVPALGDVMRKTRYDNTCQSGHEERLSVAARPVNN